MDPSSTPPRERKSRKVRPYLLTGGRTSAEVDLPLETLVVVTAKGTRGVDDKPKQLRSILELATSAVSIAEVSAHRSIPLQTAKILVGDLLSSEDLSSRSLETTNPDNRPDLQLLERVLDGLQNL